MGQVCQKHNQFYEETCRWCDRPADLRPLDVLGSLMRESELAEAEQRPVRMSRHAWGLYSGIMETPTAELPPAPAEPGSWEDAVRPLYDALLDKHGGLE